MMSERKGLRASILVLVMLLAATMVAGAKWLLFRSEQIVIDPLGQLVVTRSWGRIVKIEYDHDSNGVAEAVETFEGGMDPRKNHQLPTMLMVDSNHDGTLDLEFNYRPGAGVVAGRQDLDGDGVFEARLSAHEAARPEKEIRQNLINHRGETRPTALLRTISLARQVSVGAQTT